MADDSFPLERLTEIFLAAPLLSCSLLFPLDAIRPPLASSHRLVGDDAVGRPSGCSSSCKAEWTSFPALLPLRQPDRLPADLPMLQQNRHRQREKALVHLYIAQTNMHTDALRTVPYCYTAWGEPVPSLHGLLYGVSMLLIPRSLRFAWGLEYI